MTLATPAMRPHRVEKFEQRDRDFKEMNERKAAVMEQKEKERDARQKWERERMAEERAKMAKAKALQMSEALGKLSDERDAVKQEINHAIDNRKTRVKKLMDGRETMRQKMVEKSIVCRLESKSGRGPHAAARTCSTIPHAVSAVMPGSTCPSPDRARDECFPAAWQHPPASA